MEKTASPPAVTLLFKTISTDLHGGWTLAGYRFLYVGLIFCF